MVSVSLCIYFHVASGRGTILWLESLFIQLFDGA